MIQISQLKLLHSHSEQQLREKICRTLRIKNDASFTYSITKKSIDARKKPEIYFVYTVNVDTIHENEILKKNKDKNVIFCKPKKYICPSSGNMKLEHRPVIVGAGPAGLFAALLLAEQGYQPIVIERGKKVDDRMKDVEAFWAGGRLNLESNVQFGEGGAGTFSDGKLNTAVKDSNNRQHYVLERFVEFGAAEDILYDNKPHIGTDVLCNVIRNMRNYLIVKGCSFYFDTCARDFEIENQRIKGIVCDNVRFDTDVCILALGHSSRDTFTRLNALQIPMECKQFAVGFRVEHPQSMINESQYGKSEIPGLKASPYKVTSNFPNGRGVYSFCMCPGGYVVNSSSEEGQTVVNGMSYSGRDGKNANSAIIVSVTPKDFGADDALAGMRYQIKLEQDTYNLANGNIPQQLFGDYCNNRVSDDYGSFTSSTKGSTSFANLRGLLNEEMEQSFIDGMNHFGKIIPGFNRPDAILSGIESRTSSPIRINRNEFFESNIQGLYPCGEGAGYAGGIMSAAMDGIKVAEAIIQKYKSFS